MSSYSKVPRFGVIDGETFVAHFTGAIVLTDVEMRTHPGVRDGCELTGMLGVAVGTLHPGSLQAAWEGLSAPIKFDGHQFIVRETGQPITRCRRLLLMPDGKAAAILHDADARDLIERMHGREASMSEVDLVGCSTFPSGLAGGRALLDHPLYRQTQTAADPDDAGDHLAVQERPDRFEPV